MTCVSEVTESSQLSYCLSDVFLQKIQLCNEHGMRGGPSFIILQPSVSVTAKYMADSLHQDSIRLMAMCLLTVLSAAIVKASQQVGVHPRRLGDK